MTEAERLAVYGPREHHPSVWCAHFLRCDGIGVPGYSGGGDPELCDGCEHARLARAGETSDPEPEPTSERV